MKQAYIMIGEIVKPQGVHGEVKIRPITSDYRRFDGMTEAFFKKGEAFVPISLKVRSVSPDGVFAAVNGITDRNEAEKLRGEFVYVDRAHTVELDENETLICDLVGLKGMDDEGSEVGRLTDVMQPGGNDVYVFQGPRGEVLVPALRSVVKSIDVDAGEIVLFAARLAEVAVYSDED